MAAQPWNGVAEAGVEAEREFLRSVEAIFGSRCRAAWLSGSFAYQGARPGRSDIDVVIALDEATPMPADAGTMQLIRSFVDDYLAIHARHGLDPDLEFPGEFVTPQMLDETFEWRGLAYEGSLPSPAFPPVDCSDYWLGRPDRWYNAWLSMTAFSRFLTGSRDFHAAAKLAAWKAILRFLLLRTDRASFLLDEVMLGVGQFGVKPRYPAFWDVEREWVSSALKGLEAEGLLTQAGGRVEPRRERLGEWEQRMRAAISANPDPPPLLLDPERHRDLEDYAARQWATLAGETV